MRVYEFTRINIVAVCISVLSGVITKQAQYKHKPSTNREKTKSTTEPTKEKIMTAALQVDAYKISHRNFMPENTEMICSNMTARSFRLFNVPERLHNKKAVFFGLQHFIKDYLQYEWVSFFSGLKKLQVAKLKRRFDTFFGPDAVDTKHFEELHDLGYLPLEIRALPEGSRVNEKVPFFTIHNTLPQFAWLTNYVETVMSCELWKPITVATLAHAYRKLCDEYALKTTGSMAGVEFQCHDFSFRGMSGRHDASICGAAHLLSFNGTDTLPAIDLLEDYYNANAETEFIAASVPASEHSVTSLGSAVQSELEFLRHSITEAYPTGIVSLVSDTYDYWKVLTEYSVALKDDILARQPNSLGLAKVVFRPDSGNPVDIICGLPYIEIDELFGQEVFYKFEDSNALVAKYQNKYYYAFAEVDQVTQYGDTWRENFRVELGKELLEHEVKGSIEVLWDIFGGTINEQGYKVLNPRVGLIYGDSITIERAEQIFKRLEAKGFASTNVVFGVGSYSYQYMTRDTLGMAVKATAAKVNDEIVELFKDPKTDSGTKKSARGLLRVEKEGNDFVLYDQQSPEDANWGLLETVFKDGILVKETSLAEIRERLKESV